MKKIVSIILAALMIMSVATAFAADVTYPENLASYANKEDTKQSSNIKCDTTGATVTVVEGETHSTFGEPTAIFDGVGMASTTDGSELPDDIDKSTGNKKWRWFSYNTSTPAIKIEFPKALTFNKIVYTEARKRITGYTLTFKNNGEEVGTYKNAFTDSDTDSKGRNALYLRSIDIGEAVTADEVVFKVDSAPDIVSICEMEFTNGSITLDNASSILYTSGSQKVESMMDGITYQADGKPLNPADRIVINGGNYPKITVEFAEDITFDTIKHAEVRQMIQKYTVTASKDGAEVFEEEFAFDDGNNTTNLNTTWIRSMSMGESVTADTVIIEVTELANDTNVISIAEIEFCSSAKAPKVVDESGNMLKLNASTEFGYMFDGDTSDSCKVDVSSVDAATIIFSLSEIITADSINIMSDDFTDFTLYGTVDGEKYFEIPHQGVDSDGICYFNAPELLSGVKAQLTLTDNCTELEISEIEMYRATDNAEFDALAELFMGTDTSLITDEALDSVTDDIKNPLPTSFGSYDIEWESSDSDILNPVTGEITKTYTKQRVQLTATFKRDGVEYKKNIYDITISDDISLLPEGKYSYSGEKVNLASHIVSASVSDAHGNDPRNPAYGKPAALYDEADKASGFSRDTAKSWITYARNSADFIESPYILKLELDDVIAISGIDIWVYRDTLKEIDIFVSVDGEEWTTVEDAEIITSKPDATDTSIVKMNVSFPLTYAKYVRVDINELTVIAEKFAAAYIMEIVLLNEQAKPSVSGVETSDLTDLNADTYVEIEDSASIIVDMGEITGFDSLRWLSSGASVKDYSISVSNNCEVWEKVKDGQLFQTGDSLTEIDLGTYPVARYVKIDIESLHTDESIKISEIDFTEKSGYDLYRTEKDFVNLIVNNDTDILVGEDLTLLTADELDAIVEEVSFYDLTWDFSGAPMINPETKEITHGAQDEPGVIGVSVFDSTTDSEIYRHAFDVVVKAAFDEASYYAATEQATVFGAYDMGRPEGFLFNQSNMMVEFSMEDSDLGKVTLNSEDELFDITFNETEITVNYKNRIKTIKRNSDMSVRVIFYKDKFELYTKTGSEPFRGIIGDGAYKNDISEGIKSINTDIELADVKFKIYNDCVSDLLQQLKFSHISNESMYSVTEQLSLIEELVGLDIVWTSSKNDAINAQTGAINNSAEPCYVELTASVNESGVTQWSKTFYATVNMENIISQGAVSTNTVSYEGNVLSNLSDADIDTSFVTNYKNGYNIKITFPENTPFSQIAILEDNDEGSIDEFDIYVDDTLVHEGGKVNGFINCLFDSVMGKEVKIVIKKTTGITGIREISIHSELSDAQKATSDIKSVGLLSSYENGTYTFPKTGEYGSALAYSSNKSIISFAENADSFTMTVDNDSVDTAVVVTLTATLNGKQASKTYSIIAKGKQSVSYDPPSGGGGGGGSSGGGNNASYAPDGTTASPEPVTSEKDELYGHWAEEEIRSLVNRGIVQGTGDSLNLDSKVTRAEFLTMLTRVLETELSENAPVFSDVKNSDWYASVVQTAYEKGWVEGYNNNVSPNSYITREEMVKIICCALEITYDENTPVVEFADGDMQSEWAINYISALSSKNIINGYEDGSFRPKNNLKRDEAMIVIYRICNMEVE